MKRLSKDIIKAYSPNIMPVYRLNGTPSPGICHIGVGGFHRAHLAYYMDEIHRSQGLLSNWGIHGIGIKERD